MHSHFKYVRNNRNEVVDNFLHTYFLFYKQRISKESDIGLFLLNSIIIAFLIFNIEIYYVFAFVNGGLSFLIGIQIHTFVN